VAAVSTSACSAGRFQGEPSFVFSLYLRNYGAIAP
jgi:hypothetical protein